MRHRRGRSGRGDGRRLPPVRWPSLVAVLFALVLALPAAADSGARIPGSADPGFRAALGAWLEDDDAMALPALANLAADGNAAAQILITLIDRMPETHALWLAGLTRAERARLMRTPDGRSWMEAAEHVPLARLWLALWSADTDPAVALAFVDLGERRAARLTLLAHSARQGSGFAELARDPRYPAELRYLAWADAPAAPETRAERAALDPGDPQANPRLMVPDEAALADWLLSAERAAPVARHCTTTCPADPASCALAAYRALGGYRGLMSLGPPSANIVPEAQWLDSPKGARALPRRIAILKPPGIADACLARSVALSY